VDFSHKHVAKLIICLVSATGCTRTSSAQSCNAVARAVHPVVKLTTASVRRRAEAARHGRPGRIYAVAGSAAVSGAATQRGRTGAAAGVAGRRAGLPRGPGPGAGVLRGVRDAPAPAAAAAGRAAGGAGAGRAAGQCVDGCAGGGPWQHAGDARRAAGQGGGQAGARRRRGARAGAGALRHRLARPAAQGRGRARGGQSAPGRLVLFFREGGCAACGGVRLPRPVLWRARWALPGVCLWLLLVCCGDGRTRLSSALVCTHSVTRPVFTGKVAYL